jgi:hypothetical protein
MLIRLWGIQKKIQLLDRMWLFGFIRVERCALKLKYEKIQKSIFSIDKANIFQLFLLDKLVSRQGLFSKKYFLDWFFLAKNRSKKHF